MEYPSYSIYPGSPTEERVKEDGLYLYDFITKILGAHCDSIYCIGRSLGTFVASSVACGRKVKAVCLVSPFVSIKVYSDH